MPIFEYQCNNPYCASVFEKLVLDDMESPVCPCGSRATKILSPCNHVEKGKYTAKTGYSYEGQNMPLGATRRGGKKGE